MFTLVLDKRLEQHFQTPKNVPQNQSGDTQSAATCEAEIPVASDRHWKEFGARRQSRGWEWIALSMGLAPEVGLTSKLAGEQKAEYVRRKRLVTHSATDRPSGPGKIQYEIDVKLPSSSDTRAGQPFNWSFDVVKLVDFLRACPDLEVHPNLIEIADHWRRVGQDAEAKEAGVAATVTVSAKHEKAAKTRVEKSALDLILGMAVAKYGYRPIGLVSDAKNASSQDEVLEKIAASLKLLGLTVAVGVIQTRLAEAAKHLKPEEKDALVAKVEAMKPRATASKR